MRKSFAILTLATLLAVIGTAQAQYTQKWSCQSRPDILLDVGNTDGDPQVELLYSNMDDSLILIDGLTGQREWSYRDAYIHFAQSTYYWERDAGPQLVDVDDDGVDEILFSTYSTAPPIIHCYDSNISLGINDQDDSTLLPKSVELGQNYPNPFNPSTTISFSVSERSHVTLTIYNVLGQKVSTLVDEEKSAGDYQVSWDGSGATGDKLASGIYFYAVQTESQSEAKKMLLLK